MRLNEMALPLIIVGVWLAMLLQKPEPVSYVALLENPDGTTGKIVVSGEKGTQWIDQARSGAPLDGSEPAVPISDEKLKEDFGAVLAARPMMPERYLLYFESGTQLTAESEALLPRILDSAARRPGVDVSVIGHTDTVGKAEANAVLGLKRAQAIADRLVGMGLKTNALSVESHGEANPLVWTADETPEPRNRRVEVSIR